MGPLHQRPTLAGLDVGAELGEGAGGVVFAADEPELGRDVAVKVLSGGPRVGPVEQRFVDEARITARIDHPGVVPVHRLLRTDDGKPAYVMKRVRGATLYEWLERRGREVDEGARSDRADLASRLEVFLKLADTVHFAHTRGVVHRDLKPENVMIGEHGEVWVMDWGIAAEAGRPVGSALEGTPGYLAPEQANGAAPQPAQDQYALGLLLQELVCLRPAVPGRTALERAMANATGQRAPLRARGGGAVPRELAAIVARATSVEPGDRYGDVAALAADVRRHLAGQAVLAAPDGPLQAAARWVGRHREATLAAGVAGLALAAALVAASEVGRARQGEQARREELRTASRVAAVAARAARLDARLVRDQGLLGEIAAVTAERLRAPRPGSPPWFQDDPAAPADLRPHPAWGQPVSASTVVFVGPPGADRAPAAALGDLGPVMRDLAARAADDAASADREPPIPWISVGFADGLSFSWPGHAEFTPGYDARHRPWYTVAIGADGPVWGAPYVDSSGLGLLLPCSVPVRLPDDGRVVGVASLKLSVSRLIGDLLAWDGASAYLLDAGGHVLAASPGGADGTTGSDGPTPPPLFDDPAVLDAVRGQRPYAGDRGGAAVVVHPVPTLRGGYVVRGPRDRW